MYSDLHTRVFWELSEAKSCKGSLDRISAGQSTSSYWLSNLKTRVIKKGLVGRVSRLATAQIALFGRGVVR